MYKGILYNTKVYQIGHIEYQCGRHWREKMQQELMELGIVVFNPYLRPFIEDEDEDEAARTKWKEWRKDGEFDKVTERANKVRRLDLRCVDLAHWLVAYIDPKIPSWGSAEEISVAVKEKKIVLLAIEGGKTQCPYWIFSMIPHNQMFDSLGELTEYIKNVDSGKVKIDMNKWKLPKLEYR